MMLPDCNLVMRGLPRYGMSGIPINSRLCTAKLKIVLLTDIFRAQFIIYCLIGCLLRPHPAALITFIKIGKMALVCLSLATQCEPSQTCLHRIPLPFGVGGYGVAVI